MKKFLNFLFEQDNSIIRASIVAIILSLSIFNIVWPVVDTIITGEQNYNIFKDPEKESQEKFKNNVKDLKNFAENEYTIEYSNGKMSSNVTKCFSLKYLIDKGVAPKKEYQNYNGSIEIKCVNKKCSYRIWLSNDKYGVNDFNYDEINITKFEKGIKASDNCGK